MKKSALLLALLAATSSCASANDVEVVRPQPVDPAAPALRPAALREPTYRVTVDGLPAIGRTDALLTIVLFTDYECPFCRRIEATIAELRARYGDEMRVAVAEHPLPFHSRGRPAALAALAAAKQGRFEGMHARLVRLDGKLDDAALLGAAREEGLDVERFEQDRSDAAAARSLAEVAELARRFGALGTPTLFVNGRRIVGANPEALRRAAEEEIETARALARSGTPRERIYDAIVAGGLERATDDRPDPSLPRPAVAWVEAKDDARVLSGYTKDIGACTHAAGAPAAATSARFTLTFRVRADGTVASAEADPAGPVGACIGERARAWTFPTTGAERTVKLPLVLSWAS
jgi:protein-disulfide isomerase